MEEEFEYFSHCLLTNTDLYANGEYGLVDSETIHSEYPNQTVQWPGHPTGVRRSYPLVSQYVKP